MSSFPRSSKPPVTPATACLLAAGPTHRRRRSPLSLSFLKAAARPLLIATSSSSPRSPDASHIACCYFSVAPSSPASSPRLALRDGGGLLLIAATASVVAVSASFIFFSVIRSMLACKRAAESLEKFFDSAREKLPETMAAVRLVGREASDLTIDFSDLGQELTKGVRNSMSVVHTAEAQLHQLTTAMPQGSVQRLANRKKGAEEPLLASMVRNLREVIADGRSACGIAFSIIRLFMWASNFGSNRPHNQP